jgi:hypothetical protein
MSSATIACPEIKAQKDTGHVMGLWGGKNAVGTEDILIAQ